MSPLTTEEKIDYIYESLRKKERNEKIFFALKWGFRIAVFGYLYYFFMIAIPARIDAMIPDFPEMPSFSLGRGEESGSGEISGSGAFSELQNYFNSYFEE
jgi:hypothetical protein